MKIILKNVRLEFQADIFDVDVYIDSQTTIESPEFKSAIVDSDNKILWGRYIDDTVTDIDLSGKTVDGVAVSKIVSAIISKYDL